MQSILTICVHLEVKVIAQYSHTIFDSLSPFFIARNEVKNFKEMLIKVGDIICKYNLHKFIGVSMLHKHFNLHSDEILVEQISQQGSLIKPSKSKESVFPYMWKLFYDQASNKLMWSPLEFIKLDEQSKQLNIIANLKNLETNTKFLEEIAELLNEHSLQNIFGLSLLHRDFIKVGTHEMLVEIEGEEERTLRFQIMSKDETLTSDLVETLWCFTPEEATDNSELVCNSHCSSHCMSHCYNH